MIVNAGNLASVFSGFKTVFNTAFEGAESHYERISMTVPSQSKEEIYGWLGQFPKMREWVGDRVINNLSVHDWRIKNRKFENTIAVKRDDIEDDSYGLYSPMISEMGRDARLHPDELVFSLLADGFNQLCYDRQNFFDTDHPVINAQGNTVSVSNMQAGDGPAWYLLDLSRAVRPIIWQTRVPYDFTAIDRATDENVFMRDEYIYGVRARVNAGFGLWQLAFASKAALTKGNFEAARQAMIELRGDHGRLLNVQPTTLLVPPSLEGAARRLLKNGSTIVEVDDGNDGTHPVAVANEWVDSAELIVSPWLAA